MLEIQKNIPFYKLENVITIIKSLNLKEKACKLFLEKKSNLIQNEILNIQNTGSSLVYANMYSAFFFNMLGFFF
jgi:hypothetical protein